MTSQKKSHITLTGAKKGSRIVQCLGCNKKYRKQNFELSRTGRNFCTRDCYRRTGRERNHPLWSGHGYVNNQGYRIMHIGDRHILEHRLVMEKKLGRRLHAFESIHHKNGDRLDNRLSNLELWVTHQPRGQRVKDLIRYLVKNHKWKLIEAIDDYPA